MYMPSRETVEYLRRKFPVGCKVELVRMDDIAAPPVGTIGEVTGVDDAGSVMVIWSNGSSLSIILGVDICHRIDE